MARAAADTEMPFLDHLEELRHRLFWIAGAIVVGVVLAFVVLSQKHLDIVGVLAQPIKPFLQGESLVYTHPGTSFKIILNASVICGLLLAAPVIAYQLWGFFAPALLPHEKRVIVPVVLAMVALFLAGVALCFFFVLPFTLRFFHGFESATLTPMIEATQYFGFVFSMMLVFGIAFQLPIAIMMLTALGIVTPQFLAKYRRHAVVVVLIASALITPDASPTTLFALAGPLYLLFELGVALSYVITRRRRRRAAAEELRERREAAAEAAAEAAVGTGPLGRGDPRRLGAKA